MSVFSTSKLSLMLDHTKPSVEKIYSIDAELAGHAHKLASTVVSRCLAEFFNSCINERVFPASLKIARITPIPKILNPHQHSLLFSCVIQSV